MQLSHCFCWLILPENRLNTCKGWHFKQHFKNHLCCEWELCKLDLPMLSNSELAILTRWNDLYFFRQHLALSINTWLDSKSLHSKTYQTVKSRMWLGEQERPMSIWYMCTSLSAKAPQVWSWGMKTTWICWLSPEQQARANPSEKALDVTGPPFRWRQEWTPDLRLLKDAQDKVSALERRAELWQTLLLALRGRSTVCNLCSSLWVSLSCERPTAGLYGPHTVLQGHTCSAARSNTSLELAL